MADEGILDAVKQTFRQWMLPTKSNTEIQLNQEEREIKAADNVAKAYESLSERDESKVNTGMSLYQKIRSKQIQQEPKEGKKNG